MAVIADGTAYRLSTASRAPRTPAELIPPYRLATFGFLTLPVAEEHAEKVAGAAGSHQRGFSRPIPCSLALPCAGRPAVNAVLGEPEPVTLFVYLDRLLPLREAVLGLIDGIAALRLALILIFAACARCPSARPHRRIASLRPPRRTRRPRPSCPPVDVRHRRGVRPHLLTSRALPA